MSSFPSRRLSLLLSALLLAGASVSAQAADLLDTVKARGTLKVALEGNYPPFNFKDPKTRELTGFEVGGGELCLQAQLGRQQFGHIDFKASQFTGFRILEVERRIIAFQRNLERAARLDGVKQVGGLCAHAGAGQQQCAQ